MEYRSEIDGLRAIAVSSVVLYHAGVGGAGYVGVDIFFVISGYLITRILAAEHAAAGRIDMLAFYARRVRRILPALVLVVLATVLASCIVLPPYDELRAAASSATAALLFVANLYFEFSTGGYFDPATERLPLLHLWSLGVEEQFYLLWPLVLAIVLRLSARQAGVCVCLLAGLSLLGAELLLHLGYTDAAFYQMPARFWELAAGGAIALWPRRHWPRPALVAMLGLSLLAVSVTLPLARFPGLGALPTVLGTMLVVGAVHSGGALGGAGSLLRSPPLVALGLVSYSLYLWHWPLLALARNLSAGEPSAWLRLMLCAAAVVLAAASYRWVEQPLRKPHAGTGPGRLVTAAMLTSVSLAAASHAIAVSVAGRPPPMDLASRIAGDGPPNRHVCNFRTDEPLDEFPKPGCVVGSGDAVRVAVWGDSHALAWQPFAWALAARQGGKSISFVRDACPPALQVDNGKRGLEGELCRAFNARTVDALRGIDTLVIAARWPRDERQAAFHAAFAATLEQLAPRFSRIFLVGPTPELPDAVPHCMRVGDPDACAIGRADHEARIRPTRQALRSLSMRYPNVTFVDVTDFFCDRTRCPPMKDGYGLFWDSNHVTSTAARRFAETYLAPTQGAERSGR